MPLEASHVNRIPPRTFTALLSYYKTTSNNFAKLSCQMCRGTLDVHQPDQNQPEQFLGTCSGCGRWYRIAPMTEAGLTMLELPDFTQIITSPPSSDGKG